MNDRTTEQDLPTVNDQESCQSTLRDKIKDALDESEKIGIAKYGTALQPLNGRDAIRDIFEEWVDLGVYLEQISRERVEVIKVLERALTVAVNVQNHTLRDDIMVTLLGMGVAVNAG